MKTTIMPPLVFSWMFLVALSVCDGFAFARVGSSASFASSGSSASSASFALSVTQDPDNNTNNTNDEPLADSENKSTRWSNLNARIKERIVQEGQARAIANKKKRLPAADKKRQLLMYVKQQQRAKKQAAKVQRPLPFDQRTPLSALIVGMNVTGTVISLTKFGAYVDIGTECDGLLHVSQMSDQGFVQHPNQVLEPGQNIHVKVRSWNAQQKKLHLTMLSDEVLQQEKARQDEAEERIPLSDIYVDDELWGQLRRVTDYGAYVEVGAVVDGWLHFMDHPAFQDADGAHPSHYMQPGDRVRVWVADVDHNQQRVKLTAHRPPHLPGPRRVV